MNPAAKSVFTAYFGAPGNTYTGLAILLFFIIVFAWIIVIIKAFKERGIKKDDSDVMITVVRGLFMMLIITAIFMS